jgi:hypothetical protein
MTTTNKLIEDADVLIEENEATLGIANVDHINSQYEHYLNMAEDDLDNLDKSDCIAVQYILTQYAISVNKKFNKLSTDLMINKILYNRELAKVWASYADGYMSNDMKIACADNEYSYLREMHDEILKLTAIVNSMEGLVDRVDGMIKIIKGLEYTKGKM